MKTLKTIAVFVALSAAVSPVMATAINGAVSLSGTYTVDGTNFKPFNPITNPTGATAFTSFSSVEVESATGDYSGTVGQAVTHNAFVFDPFLTAITPLWTFTMGGTTYSFNLNSLTIDYRAANSIVLSGLGEANITGFDTTPGDWTFTANSGGGTFSFSSTNTVPDGGATAMLMGVGLLGLGAIRRKIS
jgi:hypothetical protein